MKKEVLSAVNFLVDLLRINSSPHLNDDQLLKFRDYAYECLSLHYKDHWFPDKPMKGSGYRCIRINGKMDPLLAKAGDVMGLTADSIRSLFPTELTMWVDPSEVAYRIGENGSICNLFVQKPKNSSNSTSTTETATQDLSQSPLTGVKAAPPHHRPPSSPQLTIQQLKRQQFSPSKTPVSTSVQVQTPPRSPVPSNMVQLRAQQHQLSLFLMNNHSTNCKDTLRNAALDSTRGMERLFVSS